MDEERDNRRVRRIGGGVIRSVDGRGGLRGYGWVERRVRDGE